MTGPLIEAEIKIGAGTKAIIFRKIYAICYCKYNIRIYRHNYATLSIQYLYKL